MKRLIIKVSIAVILCGVQPCYSVGLERSSVSGAQSELSIPAMEQDMDLMERDYTRLRDFLPQPFSSDIECKSPIECSPESFPSVEAATSKGAICENLKSQEAKSCVVRLAGHSCDPTGQLACLVVYDEQNDHSVKRHEIITPPTYYEDLLFDFIERPNTNIKFLRIQHTGDHGTGVGEEIHWILAWNGKAFKTIFREAVFAHEDQLEDCSSVYRVKYAIKTEPTISIYIKHFYDKLQKRPFPEDVHVSWSEVLVYDDRTMSFYNNNRIKEALSFSEEIGLKVRSSVENNRKVITSMPVLPKQQYGWDDVESFWSKIGSSIIETETEIAK